MMSLVRDTASQSSTSFSASHSFSCACVRTNSLPFRSVKCTHFNSQICTYLTPANQPCYSKTLHAKACCGNMRHLRFI